MQPNSVPAFLSIDVEPDAFQLSRNETPAWEGFDAMVPFIESLRARLAGFSDTSPTFGWFLRTDPQIAEAYGCADHALKFYADRIAGFRSVGDYIGVHAHPIRWSEQHDSWVHDYSDKQWLRACTRSSLEVFALWAGAPARHFRFGAGFLNNDIVDTAEACGILAEMTLEPAASWGPNASVVPTSVDSSPIVGAYIDCDGAPRVPYHPEHEDFRFCIAYRSRSILLVPLTTVMVSRSPNSAPISHTLYPSIPWSNPSVFWDLAMQQLTTMERPFLSLAVRTDTHDMELTAGVRRVFDALPNHPIAQYLRWMDPLDAVDGLI